MKTYVVKDADYYHVIRETGKSYTIKFNVPIVVMSDGKYELADQVFETPEELAEYCSIDYDFDISTDITSINEYMTSENLTVEDYARECIEYNDIIGMHEELPALKIARQNAGLTQFQMSKELGIPLRTIEDWEREVSSPPEYVRRLVINELDRLKIQKNKLTRKNFLGGIKMKIRSEKELKEFFEKLYSITNKNEPTEEDLKALCEMRNEIQAKIETRENDKNLYGYITKIGFVESLRGSDSHDVIVALLTNRLIYDGFDYKNDAVYKNVMEEDAAKTIDWNLPEETIAALQNMYMLEELNASIKDLENAE